MPFTVLIDDNAHYQDESERRTHGEFETYGQALIAAKQLVDRFLAENSSHHDTASSLYRQYCTYGEDPFIVPRPAEAVGEAFSARSYAKLRCEQLFPDC